MISNKIIKYILLNFGDRVYNVDLNKIIYRRLDKYLLEEKILTKEEIMDLWSKLFEVSNETISFFDINRSTIEKVGLNWIEHYKVIPFNETPKKVSVIISDPFDVEPICLIEKLYNKQVEVYCDNLIEIQQLINLLSVNNNFEHNLDKKKVEKILDSIIISACNHNVSDLHFDIKNNKGQLFFRKDGILFKFMDFDLSLYNKIINKIKLESNLDITLTNKPLDGYWHYIRGKNKIDIRVSMIPTIDGERVVLRLLNYQSKNKSLKELGFTNKQYQDIISCLNGGGIIFLTGPTGSGKTTTLYSILEFIKNHNKNIMTVEDPIEKKVEGISQIPLNSLDYSEILKNIIRQDPDVIMIGEIRDSETAQMAIKLAQTGHLVLTTIHSKDSLGVLLRLENLGLKRYLIHDTIKLIISQRLIRNKCNSCHGISSDNCKDCFGTGYSGRKMIAEVIKIDNVIKEFLEKDNYKHLILKYKQEDLFKNVCKPLLENNNILYEELIQLGLTD